MAKLVRFQDSRTQCWSRVDLENGDPIYISVFSNGVVVKKSNLGIMGARLYKAELYKAAATAQNLDSQITEYFTPFEMTNIILKALTQVALDSKSVASLTVKLNKAKEEGWTEDILK